MSGNSWYSGRRSGVANAPPEAACRVLMALTGVVVLQLDPPDFSIAPQATLPMLLAYLTFAIAALVRERRGVPTHPHIAWLDLGWCLALTAVTGGTSSVLFFFLLLPIVSRSFRDGFDAGWTMTWVTTAGYLLVGLPTSPGGILFEFNRAMIRPITLLILGYILSQEGGAQKRAQRKLALLAQINTIANPRFGVDRTLLNAAERIRDSYGSAECLIVLARDLGGDCVVARSNAERSTIETLPAMVAAPLLALPPDALVLHSPTAFVCVGNTTDAIDERCRGLGDTLGAAAFATVPVGRDTATRGRIYVLDTQLRQFDEAELTFLADTALHLLHIVDKVDLLDRLASLAAERERRRIAHDLHDLAIQPYLGLQLGLEAALRRPDNSTQTTDDLRGLLQLAHQGADELRRMLAGQRATATDGELIPESLGRLAQQYREHFDIEFRFDAEPGIRVTDRLAADLLAMIGEGLSNIRRHTTSRWAKLRIFRDGEDIRFTLENERPAGGTASFIPKSIRDRAHGLGGDARVEHALTGDTIVHVRIPL